MFDYSLTLYSSQLHTHKYKFINLYRDRKRWSFICKASY